MAGSSGVRAAARARAAAEREAAVPTRRRTWAIVIAAGVVVVESAGRLSSLHTHDTSGILHVESPVVTTFHLDQAFVEWGVRLSSGAVR